MALHCTWCETQMKRGRQPKRFCSDTCRQHFHNGCRLLGEDMVRTGAVSIATLKLHANTAGKAVNGTQAAD